MSDYLSLIQEKLEYTFQDISLLKLALTHSSFANENYSTEHNERLEFLGDAVLELFISHTVYHRHQNEREGTLTSLRSRMVNEKKLAKIAKDFSLGSALYMGRGEEKQGGRNRPALLADALEAIIGAVFLDSNHEKTQQVLAHIFRNEWPEIETLTQKKSFKTILQEYTQAHFQFTPEYTLISDKGPEHAKTFVVSYSSPKSHSGEGKLKTKGTGHSLKHAEHEAAKAALEKYDTLFPHLKK